MEIRGKLYPSIPLPRLECFGVLVVVRVVRQSLYEEVSEFRVIQV